MPGGRKKWSATEMTQAIEAVRNKTLTFHKAAKYYGVPVGSLHRLVQKEGPANEISAVKLGRRSVLGKEIEESLVNYLLILEQYFFGMTRTDLQRMAYELAVRNNVRHPFGDAEIAGNALISFFFSRSRKL